MRLTMARIADIRQGGNCTMAEHAALVDMAEESIRLREALRLIASGDADPFENESIQIASCMRIARAALGDDQ